MHFTNPEKVIKELTLVPGAVVADVGAGVGFYSFPLARELAKFEPAGKVYAIDVQRELLARLQKHASDDGIGNIEILWADADEPGGAKLDDGACDNVVVANSLFQSEHKGQFASEVARILRPGGELLLVEWSESFGHLGPTPEAIVSPETARELFKDAGLTEVRDFPTGEHHYAMILTKQAG